MTNNPSAKERIFNLESWKPKTVLSPQEYLGAFKEPKFMRGGIELNKDIPAGYTYLGQFLAHELSFDWRFGTDIDDYYDPSFHPRTPKIDLDSIYGGGPISSPFLFDQHLNNGRTHFWLNQVKVVIKKTESLLIHDLPRVFHSPNFHIPIVPDNRNDENFIISQLHVAIMLFHNATVDYKIKEIKKNKNIKWDIPVDFLGTEIELRTRYHGQRFQGRTEQNNWVEEFQSLINDLENISRKFYQEKNETVVHEDLKEDWIAFQCKQNSLWDIIFLWAKQQTKWHFQWIILHDYLPRILGKDILAKIAGADSMADSRKKGYPFSLEIFREKKPFLSLEFSMAVFRFGHSMVVESYNFSTGNSKEITRAKSPNQLPSDLYIDWSMFFFNPQKSSGNSSNKINLNIDTTLLKDLPFNCANKNIVYRNIISGYRAQLASGQAIAETMKEPIVNKDLFIKKSKDEFEKLRENFPFGESDFADFCDHSPLWFYILMEAQVLGQYKYKDGDNTKTGHHLGPVGGRIVGETILGLLKADKTSFVNVDPDWRPDFYDNLKSGQELERGDCSMIEFLKASKVYPKAVIG